MSKIIQIKRGNGTPPELQYGEPAFDNENKKLYVGSEDGTPIKIGGDDIGKQYTDNQGNVCGEIFNDYERNKAFSIGSHAEGGNNIAGGRGYKILSQIDLQDGTGIYNLRTVEGLEVGMEYSIRTGFSKPKAGSIVEISDTSIIVTNFQTVDLVDETKYPDDPNNFIARNYLMIVDHPELGDMDIGFNAHAEGEENIAHDADTHVEGWNNKALAMFGHAEGRQNIVGYAAHAEGWSNEALGDISHTEGKGNKALALGSHVEGRENKSNENANYSHVEGWLSETKAPHSHAEGYGVITKGEFTHGEGYLTTPIGESSHTEGERTVSLGNGSHAEGGSTTHAETIIYENGKLLSDIDIYNKWTTTKFSLSKGKYSHIEGLHNLAIGENSHAEGEENFVKGKTSHSEGFSNTSEGNYSHVEGGKNIGQSNYSHIEGYNNKITDSSSVGIHIEGYQNTGLGLGAHVEGRQNTVSSGASHAEGRENTVNALYAHGEGYKNTITAQSAHGEGQNNSASGIASHVEGSNNIASAENSHAEGQRTTASGKNSHAQNYYTTASGENQTVIGKHNIVDDTYAFIIGNGTALAKKSNAHTVDWEGNAWFSGRLYTANNIAGVTGYYFTNINFETNEITLSKTQSQNPTSEFNIKYKVGDVISLTNNAKYYNCSTIIKVDKNIVTVDSLPFTSIYETDNPSPDEWIFFVINKPTYGEVRLGLNATAFGENTNALERSSYAEGRETIAYGSYSHAEGRKTQAGFTAHAEGRETIASGEYSHTEGLRTKAIGNRSHAEGENTEALALYTHAEGYRTKANGSAAHAEGYETNSISNYTHSEGFKTTASGQSSHSEGSNTTAQGSASHAEGGNTVASGDNSHVEGLNSKSLGEASHAEGFGTTASAERSHSEGQNTQANGRASHAEGINSITFSEGAHTEGFSTIVYGNYSHAEGFGTIARGDTQHVEGKYNKEDNNHKYIHISGNGYVDENSDEIIRSNAYTLDWNGNAWFAGNITIGIEKNKLLTENDLTEKYIKNTDYAAYDKAGIISVGNGLIIENDKIHIDEATEVELEEKCECHRSVTPDYIDTAVYYSTHKNMSDDYLVSNLKTSDKFNGNEGDLPVSYNAVKGYIDIQIGDIKNVLNELHIYAQNLINRGEE